MQPVTAQNHEIKICGVEKGSDLSWDCSMARPALRAIMGENVHAVRAFQSSERSLVSGDAQGITKPIHIWTTTTMLSLD